MNNSIQGYTDPTDYALGEMRKCFTRASKRLWEGEEVNLGIKVPPASNPQGKVALIKEVQHGDFTE